MARAIFISYRRDDSEGEAGRLFDDLVRVFGDDSVFMDVAGINPGTDFRKAIDSNVATCGVLLAVIGPHWVDVIDRTGRRRLEDENDFVRLETASALSRNIPVIPVLVHDAKMPTPDQLPDNLKDLAYRNSVEITHARWNSDVALLTKALAQYVGTSVSADTQPVHATVPVQLPAPGGAATSSAPAKSSRTGLIAGIAVAAVLVVGLGAFFALHSHPQPNTPPSGSTTSASGPAGTSGSTMGGVSAATSAAVPAAVAAAPSSSAEPPASESHASNGVPITSVGSPFVGTWMNRGQFANNTLHRLQVTRSGTGVAIHGWGGCAGCDWGEQPAEVNGQQATAVFHLGYMGGDRDDRTAVVTIAPAEGNLAVTVKNQYPKGGGNARQSLFVRAQ